MSTTRVVLNSGGLGISPPGYQATALPDFFSSQLASFPIYKRGSQVANNGFQSTIPWGKTFPAQPICAFLIVGANGNKLFDYNFLRFWQQNTGSNICRVACSTSATGFLLTFTCNNFAGAFITSPITCNYMVLDQ